MLQQSDSGIQLFLRQSLCVDDGGQLTAVHLLHQSCTGSLQGVFRVISRIRDGHRFGGEAVAKALDAQVCHRTLTH